MFIGVLGFAMAESMGVFYYNNSPGLLFELRSSRFAASGYFDVKS
jgi:hypothetical protein